MKSLLERLRFATGTIVIRPHLKQHLLYPIMAAAVVAFGGWLWKLILNPGVVPPNLMHEIRNHAALEAIVAGMVVLFTIGRVQYQILRSPDFAREYFRLLDAALYELGRPRATQASVKGGVHAGETVMSQAADQDTGLDRLHRAADEIAAVSAQIGRALQFEPDNIAVDQLHGVNGILSMTMARPSDWLNPTYNFFLLNNYLATLARAVSQRAGGTVRLVNRGDPEHLEFRDLGKRRLSELAKIQTAADLMEFFKHTPGTMRFYFLTRKEAERTQSTLQLLLAGHELFGCHLYIVDQDKVRVEDADGGHVALHAFLRSMQYRWQENDRRIDFAIGVYGPPGKRDLRLEFVSRESDTLRTRDIGGEAAQHLVMSVREVCKAVHHQYDTETLLNTWLQSSNHGVNRTFVYAAVDGERAMPAGASSVGAPASAAEEGVKL